MNIIKVEMPNLDIITHEDGSKSYENVNGKYYTLRPQLAFMVDCILHNHDKLKCSYVDILKLCKGWGGCSEEEYQTMLKILD